MIVETLIEEAMRIAEEINTENGPAASSSGAPVVTVS
jgi:(E)-4-hydroxy-3-methylbut-2-enyl-diphosphate synthase